MKQKIFNIIQIGDKSNRISRFFDIFITVTIFCNIAVIFRMLRVARIFHLFRLNAKYDSFNIITTVLYENEKRNQIISSVFIVFILMLASSLCMYSVEHEAQPTVFRNAFSGIWWSMSTLLTVGYGDIYPVTTLGCIMAICIAYLGVGAVAIPTGIISAGFVEQYQLFFCTPNHFCFTGVGSRHSHRSHHKLPAVHTSLTDAAAYRSPVS